MSHAKFFFARAAAWLFSKQNNELPSASDAWTAYEPNRLDKQKRMEEERLENLREEQKEIDRVQGLSDSDCKKKMFAAMKSGDTQVECDPILYYKEDDRVRFVIRHLSNGFAEELKTKGYSLSSKNGYAYATVIEWKKK